MTVVAKVVLENLTVEPPRIKSISVVREYGSTKLKSSCILQMNSNQAGSVYFGDRIAISLYDKKIFTGKVQTMKIEDYDEECFLLESI